MVELILSEVEGITLWAVNRKVKVMGLTSIYLISYVYYLYALGIYFGDVYVKIDSDGLVGFPHGLGHLFGMLFPFAQCKNGRP